VGTIEAGATAQAVKAPLEPAADTAAGVRAASPLAAVRRIRGVLSPVGICATSTAGMAAARTRSTGAATHMP